MGDCSHRQNPDIPDVEQPNGHPVGAPQMRRSDPTLALARDVLRSLPDISLFIFDRDLRYVFCEGSSLRAIGFEPEEMEGLSLREVLGPQADELEPMYLRALAGETLEFETVVAGRNFSVRAAPTRSSDGEITGGSLLSLDITDRCEAERAVRESIERVDRIASNVPGVVYQVRIEADGTVSYPYVSDGIRDVVGIEPGELQADPSLLVRLIHPDDLQSFDEGMGGRLISATIAQWEGRIVLADGSIRWLTLVSRPQPSRADGAIVRDGVAIDVTPQRVAEETARWHLHHDLLTGLPNRLLFRKRLDRAIAHARADGLAVGVCFIDLDRFQQTNIMLGHVAGDEVLCALADRINGSVRPGDLVARYDSDELTVLLTALPGTDVATALAARIEEACRQPVRCAGRRLVVSCSVGVAVSEADELDAERLISNANTAMYRAKQRGRARIELFSPELERQSDERAWLENRLRAAVETREFHLVYQPQVDGAGRRVGMEALLRWHPTDHVPVPPDEFVPLAEELGLIGEIGAWVLREACATAAGWARRAAPMRVCVNLSPCQLADRCLGALVAQTLAEVGLPASLLELELTESALMEQGEEGAERLAELRGLGVRISLDDFGTGFSSLARLQHLPLDALKIDRSFVAEIGVASGTEIVHSIIELAHTLGLQVTAEGVETPEQLEALRALGSDQMQGYLIGRPAPDLSALPQIQREVA
jgi:diguanylate cyclase (GGDEF)-like protein/PAS domain S-box-containing protein